MKNVQISFDEGLLDEIDRLAARQQSSRSGVVREALKYWIRQKEILELEQQWIQKLRENSEDLEDTASWAKAEKWEEE
jgi:metal-responsive CopG/Arc/MetJ family transcriptional regulator